MKLSCIDQSEADGDCYVLSVANIVIMYGSILRMQSLQRFLPAYFDFVDDQNAEEDLSPKTLKRQKMTEKGAQLNKLLKEDTPLIELSGCEFPCGGLPSTSSDAH